MKQRWIAVLGIAWASLCVVFISKAVSTVKPNTKSTGNINVEKEMAGLSADVDKIKTVTGQAVTSDAVKKEDVKPTVASAATGSAVGSGGGQTTLTANTQTNPAPTATPEMKLNMKYDRLGVVQVKDYLNVRKTPKYNGKIVGKMTNNDGCSIYYIKKGWAKIISGKVKGYVKSKYLITDAAAEAKAHQVATLRATVTTETLNVRYLPSTDANVYDQISAEEEYKIKKKDLNRAWLDDYIKKNVKKAQLKGLDMNKVYNDMANWSLISIDDDTAFISKDFYETTYNLNRAVTIKHDKKAKGSSSKGSSLVSYAMKFLGNRYVWGGTSLTNGTDCSGFVMRIYQHFGYSLPRTSSAQASATRTVSSGDVQVGDLFFYGSGHVSHVAMYIGNGQVIHASNHTDGIKISNAYYRKPIKIGRVM